MRHFQSQYLSLWLYSVNQKSPNRSAFLRSVIHFFIFIPYKCVWIHVQNRDLCTQDIVWTIAENLGSKVKQRKVIHTISERLDKWNDRNGRINVLPGPVRRSSPRGRRSATTSSCPWPFISEGKVRDHLSRCWIIQSNSQFAPSNCAVSFLDENVSLSSSFLLFIFFLFFPNLVFRRFICFSWNVSDPGSDLATGKFKIKMWFNRLVYFINVGLFTCFLTSTCLSSKENKKLSDIGCKV